MITSEEVVERVMRMGVEHCSGIPFDRLWDVAREQLKVRKSTVKPAQTFEEWATRNEAVHGRRYAFMYVGDKLQIVTVSDPSTVRFVKWRSAHLPEVCLK